MPMISGTQKALMLDRLALARIGASRLDYYQAVYHVLINGVDRTSVIRITGATITQTLNGAPDTFAMRVSGFTPVAGYTIQIYLGDIDPSHCELSGHVLAVTAVYEGDVVTNVAYDLTGIDYTWRLTTHKVNKRYGSVSATTIVTDIIASYCGVDGITGVHVAAGLPTISEMTITDDDVATAFDRVAARIGGYWYLDAAKDVHFFLTEPDVAQSVTDTRDGGWAITGSSEDLSQVRTRVIVHGGGSTAAGDLVPGLTMVPVLDGAWYADTGGLVASGPQRLSYTGKVSVVIPPLTAPVVTTGRLPAPVAPVLADGTPAGGGLTVGATYQYRLAYTTSFAGGSGETLPGPAVSRVCPASGRIQVTDPGGVLTPSITTAVYLYRTVANGAVFKLVGSMATGQTITDNAADGTLGAQNPAVADSSSPLGAGVYLYALTWRNAVGETAGGPTATVTLAVGDWPELILPLPFDPSINQWKGLYRTLVNGATLKQVNATVPMNTAAFTDLTRDASISGAATMPVVSTAGNSVIPTLVGIPTSGANAILYAIKGGDPVTVLVERNDVAAQTALAARLGSGDGVIEDVLTDGRFSIAECTVRGDAQLARYKNPIQTLTGTTRDLTAKVGRALTVTRTNPPVSGTFVIQRVTLSELAIGGTAHYVLPLRTVEASSVRFSFEDLVRQLRPN